MPFACTRLHLRMHVIIVTHCSTDDHLASIPAACDLRTHALATTEARLFQVGRSDDVFCPRVFVVEQRQKCGVNGRIPYTFCTQARPITEIRKGICYLHTGAFFEFIRMSTVTS